MNQFLRLCRWNLHLGSICGVSTPVAPKSWDDAATLSYGTTRLGEGLTCQCLPPNNEGLAAAWYFVTCIY